jgi:ABC-type nickel/cobalt efflux system permease component RcnA
VVIAVAGVAAFGPAAAASAHPLGNFTVNHYDGITVHTDAVDVLAVVDAAEIPTAQQHGSVDTNHDGILDSGERAAFAAATCPKVAAHEALTIDGTPAPLSVGASSYILRPGAAGLHTSRLECRLHAATASADRDRRVTLSDDYDAARIGWHEITATAVGVHLVASPVPAKSVSDELLHYPNDLLSSPLNVRRAALDVAPGAGRSTFAKQLAKVPGAGPLARVVGRLDRLFSGLAGARHLTLGVGLLAVLVSLLLGSAHAALPGHGKTVMAAYIAGKRGSVRDAVLVGTTVTVTHTAGVLALGLALSLSSSLAGDRVEGELGVASGLLVVLVGASLLVGALRRRHVVDHDHQHPHGHAHDHDHGHNHGHNHGQEHQHAGRRRAGLLGMGVAGGLVPSPSALVVLLGAIALGRTAFGVLLVLSYGIGMAATLTAAGLLAVRLTERWSGRISRVSIMQRLAGATPLVTAGLVMVVGAGLAARSFAVV